MKHNWAMGLLTISFLLVSNGCSHLQPGGDGAPTGGPEDVAVVAASGASAVARPEGWTDETHGNKAEPDYEVVFPRDRVNQITITIAPEHWEAMQANMAQLLGAPGTGRQGAAPRDGFAPPEGGQRQIQPLLPGGELPQQRAQRREEVPQLRQQPGSEPPQERVQPGGETPQRLMPPGGEALPGGAPGRPGMGGNLNMTPENPMWVPATIEFEGRTWTNVGVRYKGNSSLRSTWSSGSPKLPLKLDFDEFEDDHPEIKNQRFYGFKQLSMANGFGDPSYLREAATYDLLRESGLVAVQTAHYEVYMDHGDGPVRLGLYVAIEVIDDTVVRSHFGEDSGNIYEADGSAASLAQGTFDRIKNSFLKENNREAADWSDVEALYNLLHSGERTTDPQAWRTKLEAIFDVDSFLKWLAISAAIGHWDTYGQMSHNYYLYNDPENGKLTWISWDHNLVLGASPGGAPGGGAAAPGGMMPPGGAMGGRGSVSLDRKSVGANWPLIRYLLDVPDYYAAYIDHLEETVNGPFHPDRMEAKYREMARLVGAQVAQESGQQALETALQGLIQVTRERAGAVNEFLATQASGNR